MTPKHQEITKYQKAVATFTVDVSLCPHRHCRKAGTCTGGPRGTFRRTGKPFCLGDAIKARMQRAVAQKQAARMSAERAREEAKDRAAFDAFNARYAD